MGYLWDLGVVGTGLVVAVLGSGRRVKWCLKLTPGGASPSPTAGGLAERGLCACRLRREQAFEAREKQVAPLRGGVVGGEQTGWNRRVKRNAARADCENGVMELTGWEGAR